MGRLRWSKSGRLTTLRWFDSVDGEGLLPLRGCVGIVSDWEANSCFSEGDAVRDVEEDVVVPSLPEGCRSVNPDCVAFAVCRRD